MSVGVVILTKGNVPMLIDCLLSITNKTVTPHTIYIGDTGSTNEEVDSLVTFIKANFKHKNIYLHIFNRYNFAKCNNYIVNNFVKEDTILLCNNDIELIDNSIDYMYNKMRCNEDIGTIGCRLLYPDNTIQHAGQVVSIIRNTLTGRGYLAATHRGLKTTTRYKDWEPVVGNTGGFMMISKDVYQSNGGLNENYKECFEDVEFNLKLLSNGKCNMYTDSVSCYHKESITRGKRGMTKEMLHDHSNLLTPFFNSLDVNTKNKILNFTSNID